MKKKWRVIFAVITTVVCVMSACAARPANQESKQEEKLTYEAITEELEGTEYTTSVKWSLSGKDGELDVSDQIVSFDKILNGDFDHDGEDEVVLTFDLHSVGGNGGYGLYMFKWKENSWKNVSGEEPFVGFDTECLPFDELTVEEESDGTYLRMKQYCPGEDKTEHTGDVITTFFLDGDKLSIKDTEFVPEES